jgi:hypothetical protein
MSVLASAYSDLAVGAAPNKQQTGQLPRWCRQAWNAWVMAWSRRATEAFALLLFGTGIAAVADIGQAAVQFLGGLGACCTLLHCIKLVDTLLCCHASCRTQVGVAAMPKACTNVA